MSLTFHLCLSLLLMGTTNVVGNIPVLDLTTYFHYIFATNDSLEAKETLRNLLGKEKTPWIYYATDYNYDIAQTLNDTLFNVVKVIEHIDSSNLLQLKRKILLSLRPSKCSLGNGTIATSQSTLPPTTSSLSNKSFEALNSSIFFIVFDFQNLSESDLDWKGNGCSQDSLREIQDFQTFHNLTQIQIYVGYNKEAIQHKCSEIRTQTRRTSSFVVSVEFTSEVDMVESYELFRSFVDQTWEENTKCILLENEDIRRMMRITLKAHQGQYTNEFRLYQKLLRYFVGRLQVETGESVILNLVNDVEPAAMLPFDERFGEEDPIKWENVSNVLIPFWFRKNSPTTDDCVKGKLDKIATKFDTLLVDMDAWMLIGGESEEYFCRYLKTSHKAPSNILLLVNLETCSPPTSCISSLEQVSTQLENKIQIHGMTLTTIIISAENINGNISSTMLETLSSRFTLGCVTGSWRLTMDVDTQVFTDKFIALKCPTPLRKKATIYVYEFHIDFKDTLNYTQFHAPLHKIFEKVANYMGLHPKKKVVLNFVLSPFQGDLKQNMFCNENIFKMNVFVDAISNWAFIHNIEVIMKPAFDTPDSLGWWSALREHDFFARNYPPKSNFGRDPCYRWEKDLKDDIALEKFRGGITLNMGLRDCHLHNLSVWNVGEFETMVLFGLHTFQNIEIIPRMYTESFASDLETITKMFSSSYVIHTSQLNSIMTGALFLNIRLSVLNEWKKLVEASRNLENVKMGGITLRIAKSEEILLDNYNLVLNDIRKNTKFGIHVDECINLAYLEPGPALISWIMKASFVVCEMRLLFPEPDDQSPKLLQKISDAVLIKKSILLSYYPHLKDVHFRLNIFASVKREASHDERDNKERYVKLLSYILNIGRDYKITVYFRGFDNRCVHHNISWGASGTLDVVAKGWWQISNYSDLSRLSVYTDKYSGFQSIFNKIQNQLGDFGLSRKLYEYTEYVKKNQEPLPWRWMAYESLTKMEFTTKSDVWSFGVTIWEIFGLGDIPYPGLSWTVDFADNLKNGLRIGKPQYATDAMYEQMLRCWELDPDQRPGFHQLSEFFRQLHTQQMNSPIYENSANILST